MRFYVLLIICILAVGCMSHKEINKNISNQQQSVKIKPIDFSRFTVDGYSYKHRSGIASAKHYIVTNQEEWKVVWLKINNRLYPPVFSIPEAPTIDFQKITLIVVAMGEKSSGGYTIEVSNITEYANYLEVYVTSSSPGAGCFTTQAMTQPIDIIEIPK